MREGHSGLVLSPWLPGIERSQAGPEFARCRRSSRTPERREFRGRIGKGRSRQASQARPRRLSATVANSWSHGCPRIAQTLDGDGNAICWVTQAGARHEDASRVPPQPRACPAASCARKICHIALAVAELPLKLALACSSGRSVRAKAGAVSPDSDHRSNGGVRPWRNLIGSALMRNAASRSCGRTGSDHLPGDGVWTPMASGSRCWPYRQPQSIQPLKP